MASKEGGTVNGTVSIENEAAAGLERPSVSVFWPEVEVRGGW